MRALTFSKYALWGAVLGGILSCCTAQNDEERTVELHMPPVHPNSEDEYWCTSERVPQGTNYITKYEALASMDTTHHMLLYGCEEPFEDQARWKCSSNLCGKGEPHIMFAWAKNAPPTQLPPDVGFEIGGETSVQFFVLQIHYLRAFQDAGEDDTSGLRMTLTSQPPHYQAGVMILLAMNVEIPAHAKNVHGDVSCEYKGEAELHPFAFRVHAHDLSTVITGYTYNDTWNLMGKGNPQWPQAFYPMEANITIKQHDYLVARCTYDASKRDRATHIGATHNDEMCNFYFMYYTKFGEGGSSLHCYGNTSPRLAKRMPADSDVPLPPNPLLDHQHHHHADADAGAEALPGTSQRRLASVPRMAGYWQEDYGGNVPFYYDFGGGLGGGWDEDNGGYFYQVANQRKRNRKPQYDSLPVQPPYHANMEESYGGGSRSQNPSPRSRSHSQGLPRTKYSHSDLHKHKDSFQQKEAAVPTSGHVEESEPQLISFTRPQVHSFVNQAVSQPQITNKHAHKLRHEKNLPLHLVPGWTESVQLGQVAGVALDSKGNVHVFHRGPRVWDAFSFNVANQFQGKGPIAEDVLVTFSPDGKVIEKWGKDMFYMPHGIYIDSEDNIWLTDTAMHQVFRFPQGEHTPDKTLGVKLEPGPDNNHFCMPSDVTVISTGEVFVTDGYCNSRVMKFNQRDQLVNSWGTLSKDIQEDGYPTPGTFFLPHSITNVQKDNMVCVADRENKRIQCFSYGGKFIKQFHPQEISGPIYALDYCPDDDVFLVINGKDNTDRNSQIQGFTLDANTGAVLQTWSPSNKGFSRPHDVTVGSRGTVVYVTDIDDNRIFKFVRDASGIMMLRGHPSSVDSSEDEITEKRIEDENTTADFGASIVIGALLVVPVLVIVIIVVFLRVRKQLKLKLQQLTGEWDYKRRSRRFNLGGLLGGGRGGQGWKRVSTEDGEGELAHLQSDDSDDEVDEYNANTA